MHAKHRIFLFLSLLLIVAAAALLFSGGKKQETKEEPGRKHIAFSSVLPANPEKKEAEEDEAWALILVNAEHPIPEDYTVTLTLLRNGQAVDRRAYPDLQEMVDDMRAKGLSPLICSSFRTQEKQQKLYDAQVQKYLDKGYSREAAEEEASKWSAYPGTSEHQTGLALDIVSTAYQVLDEKQESTPEQAWLLENSWKYGFILRYPPEKSEITGIFYEPWHYRYVGKAAAKEIYDAGICLEEYLEE